MLDFFTQEPRVMIGSVLGLVIGGIAAYAVKAYLPSAWPALGIGSVVVGLVLGVVLGAKWEASRS